jgi:hypothetical protein
MVQLGLGGQARLMSNNKNRAMHSFDEWMALRRIAKP